jgi:hypothetical protein
MNRPNAAAKATGGKVTEKTLRGRRRITAAAQEINTSASGDLNREEPTMRRSPGERVFTGL